MQRLYASHLRKIPLDDGKERSNSGEVYAAHEVDAALAAKDAAIARLLGTLRVICKNTDPDEAESYRCDDRDGCLDQTHAAARMAIAAVNEPAQMPTRSLSMAKPISDQAYEQIELFVWGKLVDEAELRDCDLRHCAAFVRTFVWLVTAFETEISEMLHQEPKP